MPTTSPSIVTSGPPELPGLTAASNWMRLVSARSPPRDRYSRRRPETTPGRRRRPDAEREADRDDLVARREIGGRAQRRRRQVVGNCLGLKHGEIVLGSHADDGRLAIRGRRRTRTSIRSAPATTCRLVRMIPVSTMTTPVPTPCDHMAFLVLARSRCRARGRRSVARPRRPLPRAMAAARFRACAAPRRRCPAASAGAARGQSPNARARSPQRRRRRRRGGAIADAGRQTSASGKRGAEARAEAPRRSTRRPCGPASLHPRARQIPRPFASARSCCTE